MKTNDGKTLSSNLFPVVGVGASAGGLDAFTKLLKAIPEDSGLAFVLVQHLDPNHESRLTDILQKVTPIPVLEISDEIKVEPNHIYIIPSNKMLIANDGVLELSPRPKKNKKERNLPIDLFFTSLAEVHQGHAIGVVLSGTGSDGTEGLKAIKARGGLTFAQDKESAAYAAMPISAEQSGIVDFILPPGQMPQKILETNKSMKSMNGETIPMQDEDVFKQVLLQLQIRKGTDFSYYKQTTIRRRILRRMAFNKTDSPGTYLDVLRESKAEQDLLYQDLLIPVTSFFRDTKSFDLLRSFLFPLIIEDKPAEEPIRVWVTACSTGEEAYSIAMCFAECLGTNPRDVQIFATDISEPAITKARDGLYKKGELAGVSASRLKKFFTPTKDGYVVNKQLRKMCVFAQHNFVKDPAFRKMDFISCRNVLIYMQPYLQKKALTTFHYALNVKGFLFLGRTETTNSVKELYTLIEKNEKLYSRNNVPVKYRHGADLKDERGTGTHRNSVKIETMDNDFQRKADDVLLSKYNPSGVIVNEALEIVDFRGNTSAYLEQLPGKPSHNIIKMARQGLGFELRSLLHKVKKQNGQASKNAIPFERNGTVTYISIEAIPLSNTIEPYYLVIFQESQPVTEKRAPVGKTRSNGKGQTLSNKEKLDARDIRIHHLEQELAQTHEDMRAITDDQEATNEELQSDNEELSSSSEELQSLNEELETSKEELQSSNEELLIVNQEMVSLNNLMEEKVQERTRELSVANELLERKNEELQSMNKELNSFTYVASHDLQEPLRKIQIFARFLLETENQNLSDRGKDYFVRVQNAAHRMQALIQNLLTFSRISKGERKFENVNLGQIIEEVKLELSETIQGKNAIIEVNAHCSVYIIPFQFQQMMFNLIGNALKFSKPEVPAHVTIECVNMITDKTNNAGMAPGKEYCHISVRDNGIGFEPEYKEKIFELFQRLHGKDRYEGTGVGLSIVEKVVEIHNGHIFVTSQLNEGATFNIFIPVEPGKM